MRSALLCTIAVMLLLAIHVTAIRGSAKVIYGVDGRTDQYDLSTFDKALGDSTVMIIQGYDMLKYNEDGSWTATNTLNAGSMWNLCPDERFRDQPIFSRGMVFCSGFLISSDPGWVATAAHCTQGTLPLYAIVFGFEMTSNTTARLDFRASDVYSVKEVVVSGTPSGDVDDYGILALDRPVGHTAYTKINPSLEVDDKLILIGHPMGMPKKTDSTGAVTQVKENMIRGDVDSYAGSSGSPVFDQHGLLVGILTGGSEDFVYERSEGNCRESNICPGSDYDCEELGEFIVPICNLIQSNSAVQEALSHLDCNSDPASDEYFTYTASGSRCYWSMGVLALVFFLLC